MIGSGLIVGFFFDGYRVLKGRLDFPAWIVFFFDIIYGTFSGIFIFLLLVWINYGQLRFTIYLFFLLGLWFYYLILSSLLIKFWLILYELIYQVIIIFFHLLHVLVIKPIIYIYKFSIWILTTAETVIKGFLQLLKSILWPVGRFFFSPVKLQTNKIKSRLKKKEGFLSRLTNLFKR